MTKDASTATDLLIAFLLQADRKLAPEFQSAIQYQMRPRAESPEERKQALFETCISNLSQDDQRELGRLLRGMLANL